MFDINETGKRIAALRRAAGMTQNELAKRIKISYQAVSNWERGMAMPDISNLRDLAAALETSIDKLLGSDNAEAVAEIPNEVDDGNISENPMTMSIPNTREEIDRLIAELEERRGHFDNEQSEIEDQMSDIEIQIGDLEDEMSELEDRQNELEERRSIFDDIVDSLDGLEDIVNFDEVRGKIEEAMSHVRAAFADAGIGTFAREKNAPPRPIIDPSALPTATREEIHEFASSAYGDLAQFTLVEPYLDDFERRAFCERALGDGYCRHFMLLRSHIDGEWSINQSKANELASCAYGKLETFKVIIPYLDDRSLRAFRDRAMADGYMKHYELLSKAYGSEGDDLSPLRAKEIAAAAYGNYPAFSLAEKYLDDDARRDFCDRAIGDGYAQHYRLLRSHLSIEPLFSPRRAKDIAMRAYGRIETFGFIIPYLDDDTRRTYRDRALADGYHRHYEMLNASVTDSFNGDSISPQKASELAQSAYGSIEAFRKIEPFLDNDIRRAFHDRAMKDGFIEHFMLLFQTR